MIKHVVIVILILIALGEGYVLYKHQSASKQMIAQPSIKTSTLPQAGPNARGGGRPIILTKGMNLKVTPLFKYAYQIAPGDLSDRAKKALVGWTINTKKQSDGSIIVILTPKDSDDQNQQYTVTSGNTLYFIEQTPVDDKPNQDKDLNYRDDYGIIVDQNDNIQ